MAGSFVRAVTNGLERPLTYTELENLARTFVGLYLDEKEISSKDSKTDALNARAFKERLLLEINRSRRNRKPLTIVYIDLDGFKLVNETLGHHIGDLILNVTVWCMQRMVREIDVVARLGGDEFALLLPDTNADNARLVIDRVQKEIRDAVKKWAVTFSGGMVTFKANSVKSRKGRNSQKFCRPLPYHLGTAPCSLLNLA
jgi:diguanylate cyclase (GGDEF)-like protein